MDVVGVMSAGWCYPGAPFLVMHGVDGGIKGPGGLGATETVNEEMRATIFRGCRISQLGFIFILSWFIVFIVFTAFSPFFTLLLMMLICSLDLLVLFRF